MENCLVDGRRKELLQQEERGVEPLFICNSWCPGEAGPSWAIRTREYSLGNTCLPGTHHPKTNVAAFRRDWELQVLVLYPHGGGLATIKPALLASKYKTYPDGRAMPAREILSRVNSAPGRKFQHNIVISSH